MRQLPKRLLSLDVLRAITMFLMIFVNDLSGVANIPAWMEHAEGNEDRMGFADLIFPAFLFIVGLSIPLAIRARVNKGDSFLQVAIYIFTRSLALIVMGFFHVNLESYSSAAVLPYPVWGLLITIAFFLIWLDYPESWPKLKRYVPIGIGVAILVLMACLYKGGDDANPHGMEPSWWGILGIIGWAYLVCASLFFLVKENFWVLLVLLFAFLGINISNHAGFYWFNIPLIDDGSSVALVMGGIVITGTYSRLSGKGKDHLLWIIFGIAGTLAIICGFLVRPFAGGLSKIQSTPAWVLICAGITILVFELLIFLVDRKGKQDWFKIIRPAGTSTLTCYLVPYLLYFIFELTHFNYPDALNTGFGGAIRSVGVSLFVILLVRFMEKGRIRLKI
ncbi:DUF5009 domain-containing protein [Hufsiella ginkgonis]|uniref:DUF5009 domain-containing protein n=1 Tax=Hufsiella ginkgonis TaxID=2695274 RepID=A0A7K1Y061_9SPHI|nr:DUF5009 domain-containing protein [Hufsiella ginkgonis]MXV16457.1 DUF5009 domain-containing protein [Hufsiella ginkgonis]